MRSVLIAALTALMWMAGPLCAQPRRPMPRPEAVIERLSRMSPEERRHALDRLPPRRRAQVEARLDRLNALSPEARTRLRNQYEEFRKLPPEKQESARQAFRNLNRLPKDRKAAVRRAVIRLRNMTPEQRTLRLQPEAFRSRFSEAELEIVRDLSETSPPTASNE